MSDNLYKKKSLLNMAMSKNFLSKATKKRCSFIVNFPVGREWLHPFYMLTYFTLSGPYQEVVTGDTGYSVPHCSHLGFEYFFHLFITKKKSEIGYNKVLYVCLF